MAHGACAAVGSSASAAGGTLLAALSDEAAATSHLTSGCGRPAVPERAVHAQLQAQGRAALGVPGGSAHETTKQTPVVFLPLLVTVARIHTVYREVLPRHATALARGCVLRERTLLTDSAVGHQGQALVLGWIIGSLSPNPALLSGAGPPSVLHCFPVLHQEYSAVLPPVCSSSVEVAPVHEFLSVPAAGQLSSKDIFRCCAHFF